MSRTVVGQGPHNADGKVVEVHIDNFKNHPAAWQQSETIEDFLHRLPIEDPATSLVGPWLWVGRPTIPYAHTKREKSEEISTFVGAGAKLLHSFDL